MNALFDNITRTTIQLLLKEPFYGHYLSTIVKEVSSEIATMGVAVGGEELVKLYVNEKFWNEDLITDDFKYGVLKHEILHIVFKHILIVDQFDYPDIANVAMDIVVNQYIGRSQLPGEPVLIENYPSLKLERDQSVDYYYQKLLPLYKKQNKTQNQLQTDLEKHGAGNKIGSHQKWEKLSAGEKKILEASIEQAINEVVNRVKKNTKYEDLPTGLRVYFDEIEKKGKPFVNWRRTLRLFANSSSRTYLKNTIRRPSRRYGTVPGHKIKPRNKLLIAIDSSGSVPAKDLAAFFGELYHINRQGAEIMVVECDTHIQNNYLYRGMMPDFVLGGGGTDFNDPIRFANEEYLPDAIVYFTDGNAVPPKIPARMPILWMITQNGIDEQTWDKFPGRKVKMQYINPRLKGY